MLTQIGSRFRGIPFKARQHTKTLLQNCISCNAPVVNRDTSTLVRTRLRAVSFPFSVQSQPLERMSLLRALLLLSSDDGAMSHTPPIACHHMQFQRPGVDQPDHIRSADAGQPCRLLSGQYRIRIRRWPSAQASTSLIWPGPSSYSCGSVYWRSSSVPFTVWRTTPASFAGHRAQGEAEYLDLW